VIHNFLFSLGKKKTKRSKTKDNEEPYLRHGFLFADLKSKAVLVKQIKKPELSLSTAYPA